MKRIHLVVLTALAVLLPATLWAQTGGPVTVQAVDSSTSATETKVGDATNHAIRVNVVAGSSGNAAASATGSAVPASASYGGINVAGTLRGATGVNPSGSIFAQQFDLASVAGATVVTGNGTASGAIRVALPTDGTGVVGLIAGSAVIGHVIVDTTSTTAVTQATASNLNAQVQGAAASGASKAGNPVQIGGVFNTTQPTVTNGQAVEAQYSARGGAIVATGADTFNVTVNAALPAGTNVIGHVIMDTGSTTVVTGTVGVTQSGTWTVQPGNTANTTQWLVKSGPFDGCGTTTYDPAALKIPDATLDVLTGTTTCVDTIVVTNIGSASATITLQDTQGTPVELLKALTVAPNQTVTLNNLGGLKFASGIKYQASSANALNLWVKGRQ